MKSLFVVAVATGIFTGTPIETKAQANVNIERLGSQPKTGATSLKFINNIEITPDRVANDGDYYSAETKAEPAKRATRTDEGRDEAAYSDYKGLSKTPVAVNRPAASSNIEKCTAIQFKYAMMMDVEVETLTNSTLYDFIEDWWGTRYRYGGSDRDGIDCSAFTGKLTQSVFGSILPRTAREQFQACEMVANEDLKEGDLVFFNTRGGVSHVGVYLGNNYFVHSSTHSGVTINSLKDDYYSRKFLGGGRVSKTVQEENKELIIRY